MTDDRSFERAARSWLEIGPTQAPERAIDAAFLEIASTPQERDWHVPRRLPHMSQTIRLLAGAAIIAVALVGSLMLFQTGNSGVGGGPSPAPSRASRPSTCRRRATPAATTSC